MNRTKQAGIFDFLKGKSLSNVARNPVVQMVAAPLIGMGLDAGVGAVRDMMRAKGKGKAYKAMLAENPALGRKPPEQTQKYFNTLYNTSPELAHDPLVSSSWVGSQIEQNIPGHPHAGIVEGVSQIAKVRQMMRAPSNEGGGVFRQMAQTIPKDIQRLRMDLKRENFDDREAHIKKQERMNNQTSATYRASLNSLIEREQDLAQREAKLKKFYPNAD